jgi:hypothetical protein
MMAMVALVHAQREQPSASAADFLGGLAQVQLCQIPYSFSR